MPGLAGKAGKAVISAATIASVQNWKLDVTIKDIDTTALGDTWESCIAGMLSASGSLDCQYAIGTDTTGQAAVWTAFLAGTAIALKLYVDGTHYVSGSALITSVSLETTFDDAVKASFDFKTTGAWAIT